MKNSARAWPAAVLLTLGLMTTGCAIDTSASADTPSRAEIKKQRKAAKERR